jgi:hypothetical protein
VWHDAAIEASDRPIVVEQTGIGSNFRFAHLTFRCQDKDVNSILFSIIALDRQNSQTHDVFLEMTLTNRGYPRVLPE